MKVSSKTTQVQATDRKIFSLVSNCANFGNILPDQVSNWETGEDYCKFTLQGMVTLTLRIIEKQEYSKVVFQAENEHKIPILLAISIQPQESFCDVMVEIDAEVPGYLAGMVKNPLQSFVDMAVKKIETEAIK